MMLEDIKLYDINFFNYPKKYSIEDYNKLQNEIVNSLKIHNGIIGIYTYSSISTPGISDIDLLIIFDEEITKKKPIWVDKLFKSRTDLKGVLKLGINKILKKCYKMQRIKDYLLIHPPLIAPKIFIKDLPKLVALFDDPKCIYIKYSDLNIQKTEKKYFLNIFLDYPIMSEILELLSYFVRKKVNIRRTLLKLNNAKYTLYMAKSFGIWENSYKEFINSVKILRENWFDLTENEKKECIYFLLKQYINLLFELIWKAAYKLEDLFNVNIDKDKKLLYTHPSQYTVFTNKYTEKEVLTKQIYLIRKGIYPVLIYPYIYSVQLQAYSFNDGSWARFLRKHLSGYILRSDFSFIPNHKERINLLSRYVEELSKVDLLLGVGPPNFGYHI